mgnify:CR=1 FL=1
MKKFFLVLSLVFISVLGVNAAQKDTVKVLAIGNSFSEDAIEQHLSALARAEGLNVIICNMYIGGCSIERHVENLRGNKPEYRYRKFDVNGKLTEKWNHTLEAALAEEDWDYVSLQQVSQNSGIPESYVLLPELVDYVKARVPEDAVLMFHQTWAYAPKSNHGGTIKGTMGVLLSDSTIGDWFSAVCPKLRLSAEGMKFMLSNCLTGAPISWTKKSGSFLLGLLPTSTFTTSCPLPRRSEARVRAWVICPLPSP